MNHLKLLAFRTLYVNKKSSSARRCQVIEGVFVRLNKRQVFMNHPKLLALNKPHINKRPSSGRRCQVFVWGKKIPVIFLYLMADKNNKTL